MPWWGEREDKDLLIGTHRYGFSKYQKMRRDKTLIFHSILQPLPDIDEEDKDKDDDKDIEALDDDEEKDSDKKGEADGEGAPTVGPDGQPLHPWPGSKVLTHRVKHLVKDLFGIARPMKRAGGRPGRKPSMGEKDRAGRQMKLESEWYGDKRELFVELGRSDLLDMI